MKSRFDKNEEKNSSKDMILDMERLSLGLSNI